MFVQLSYLVQGRIRIQIKAQIGVGSAIVDEHHQVFGGTVRHIMREGCGPIEAQPVVEGLDIHAKPCDVLPLANQPKIATHIFKAILLMAQRGPHGTRNLREQIGGRHLCREGEPDRHHVGGNRHRVPQRSVDAA